jgi:Outer membrane protein
MKKIVFVLVLSMFLAAGTAAAAPSDTGVIDVNRIMAESQQVKASQAQLNQKGNELSAQLDAEKPSLTKEQFDARQKEIYGQFLQAKKELEAKIDTSVRQAIQEVAKEKNLRIVLYKNSVAFGGVDITTEVIVKMK